jgi:colanic acid biosynthesis protein WcaH
MLDIKNFKAVVTNAPLVSIDLCLVFQGKLLLGKRFNNPLQGCWFTPGGRIYKNEEFRTALYRIALAELGLRKIDMSAFCLMGVWDHFYNNSVFDDKTSTHYVNLPHFARFDTKPMVTADFQHDRFEWFDLNEVADGGVFHKYIQNYANWLITRGSKK